jgi:hypothetical protein
MSKLSNSTLVAIPSDNPTIPYWVNVSAINCTCESFKLGNWCDHLKSVGKYRVGTANLSARPSFSQALSGLVKGIRIRNVDEAAYWLTYCWGFRQKLGGSQFRIVRRLLIGSAEDGHSIAVMLKLSENFSTLLAKDVEFPLVMAELVRICKVANWWDAATGGHDYIYSGMLGSRKRLYNPATYPLEHCLQELEQAIVQHDKAEAQYWVMNAHECINSGATIAKKLLDLAIAINCTPAISLMRNIYLRHAHALRNDANFTCQAVWFLTGGNSAVVDQIETVTHGEVRTLIESVNATAPHIIPSWCCDGVHCAGNDIRYAGMWERMFAVCKQYNHYGKVSPDDPWLESEFLSLDGLELVSA